MGFRQSLVKVIEWLPKSKNRLKIEALEAKQLQMEKEARSVLPEIFGRGVEIREPEVRYDELYLFYFNSWPVRACVDAITREAVRPGWIWRPVWKVRCKANACQEEFERIPPGDECTQCGSKEFVFPDRAQLDAINELLDKPNDTYTFTDILKRIIRDVLVVDDWFMSAIIPPGVKAPTELWVEDVRYIKMSTDEKGRLTGPIFCPYCEEQPVLDADQVFCDKHDKALRGRETAYVQKVNGKITARFGRNEMAHGNLWAVGTRLYGSPLLRAIITPIATMAAMDNWQWDAYDKGRTPKKILVAQGMNEETVERINEKIQAWQADNRHTTPVIPTGQIENATLVPLDLLSSMVDMQTLQFQEWYMKTIFYTYGVSPTFIGVETPGKLGHYQEGFEVSLDTIEEVQKQIAETLNGSFQTWFPEIVDWEFAFNPVNPKDDVQEATVLLTKAQAAQTAVNAGLDIEVDEEGEVIITGKVRGADRPPTDPSSLFQRGHVHKTLHVDQEEDMEVADVMFSELRAFAQSLWEEMATDLQEVLEVKVEKQQTGEERRLQKLREDAVRKLMARFESREKDLRALLQRLIIEASMEGVKLAESDTGLLTQLEIPDVEAMLARSGRTAETMLNKLVPMALSRDTYIDELNKVFDEAVKENWNTDRIASELAGKFDPGKREFAHNVWKRIARTETAAYVSEGRRIGYQKMGIEKVQRKVASDACPICWPFNNKIYKTEDALGVIPAHPNCRCSWAPVVEDT
jgi:hypothetical protein